MTPKRVDTSLATRKDLLKLIEEFLSTNDRSVRLSWKIEEILTEHLIDSDLHEYLAEPLSLYRPGSTHPYIEEKEMSDVLEVTRDMATEQ